jgi:hypothetical protein
MQTLISTALMALFLLDVSFALVARRTITIAACEATSSSASASTVPLLETQNSGIATPVVVVSTVTVIPMPLNTAPGVFYSTLTGHGVPSGIFWSGYATGSERFRPTGHPKCRNHTRHHNPTHSTGSKSTLSKIPFFTLTNTNSLPLPTLLPTTAPEFTLTNTGSLPLPNLNSTACPDMSSTTSQAIPTTGIPEVTSVASVSSILGAY